MFFRYGEINRRFSFILFFTYLLTVFVSGVYGLLLACVSRGVNKPFVLQLPAIRPNVIVLILRSFIPLGITYVFIKLRCRFGVVVLLFIKTALSFYTCGVFSLAYPNSGWLIVLLMMAPECLIIGLYHWLWLHCFDFKIPLRSLDFYICAAGISVVLLAELFFICPFTASLFINK